MRKCWRIQGKHQENPEVNFRRNLLRNSWWSSRTSYPKSSWFLFLNWLTKEFQPKAELKEHLRAELWIFSFFFMFKNQIKIPVISGQQVLLQLLKYSFWLLILGSSWYLIAPIPVHIWYWNYLRIKKP